jgi:hypothetical protein
MKVSLVWYVSEMRLLCCRDLKLSAALELEMCRQMKIANPRPFLQFPRNPNLPEVLSITMTCCCVVCGLLYWLKPPKRQALLHDFPKIIKTSPRQTSSFAQTSKCLPHSLTFLFVVILDCYCGCGGLVVRFLLRGTSKNCRSMSQSHLH